MRTCSRRRLLMLALPGLFFATAAQSAPVPSRLPAGKPDVRSNTALVFDASDASVLYSKQAERVVPIASITKLMTALVVIDSEQPLDEVLQVTALDRDTKHGSGSRLAIGTKLSRGDLLHIALMSSDNRAAHAVGRSYTGGLPAFIEAMNDKAQALEMTRSRFVDPSGLSSRNVSSAADLIKLVNAAAGNPVIRKFSTGDSHTVRVGKQMLEFRNTNRLVSKPDWDILVQKTGYTSDAGQCLVMKTVIQDRPVVIVLLNSFGKYTRVADARRIRRWMESGSPAPALARTAASGSLAR